MPKDLLCGPHSNPPLYNHPRRAVWLGDASNSGFKCHPPYFRVSVTEDVAAVERGGNTLQGFRKSKKYTQAEALIWP